MLLHAIHCRAIGVFSYVHIEHLQTPSLRSVTATAVPATSGAVDGRFKLGDVCLLNLPATEDGSTGDCCSNTAERAPAAGAVEGLLDRGVDGCDKTLLAPPATKDGTAFGKILLGESPTGDDEDGILAEAVTGWSGGKTGKCRLSPNDATMEDEDNRCPVEAVIRCRLRNPRANSLGGAPEAGVCASTADNDRCATFKLRGHTKKTIKNMKV
jgi:hypothetical protein